MKLFIIKSLLQYENYIKKANTALIKSFNLSCSPLIALRNKLIPREGFFYIDEEKIQFVFHGVGCYLSIGDKIIDFDYVKIV